MSDKKIKVTLVKSVIGTKQSHRDSKAARCRCSDACPSVASIPMTASRNVEVRLSELDKLPVEEVDLLVLKQGPASSPADALVGQGHPLRQARPQDRPEGRWRHQGRARGDRGRRRLRGGRRRSLIADGRGGGDQPGSGNRQGRQVRRPLAPLVVSARRAGCVPHRRPHIPVPGIDPVKLAELFQGQQGGILGVFNLFSGGALSRFTLFASGHHALHLVLDHHATHGGRGALHRSN
jgi:hypothetical protein